MGGEVRHISAVPCRRDNVVKNAEVDTSALRIARRRTRICQLATFSVGEDRCCRIPSGSTEVHVVR